MESALVTYNFLCDWKAELYGAYVSPFDLLWEGPFYQESPSYVPSNGRKCMDALPHLPLGQQEESGRDCTVMNGALEHSLVYLNFAELAIKDIM